MTNELDRMIKLAGIRLAEDNMTTDGFDFSGISKLVDENKINTLPYGDQKEIFRLSSMIGDGGIHDAVSRAKAMIQKDPSMSSTMQSILQDLISNSGVSDVQENLSPIHGSPENPDEDLYPDQEVHQHDHDWNNNDSSEATDDDGHLVEDEGSLTFKLSRKKTEDGEFVVKAYKNGKYYEPASYYTDDWEDAVGTKADMEKREGIKEDGDMGEARELPDAVKNNFEYDPDAEATEISFDTEEPISEENTTEGVVKLISMLDGDRKTAKEIVKQLDEWVNFAGEDWSSDDFVDELMNAFPDLSEEMATEILEMHEMGEIGVSASSYNEFGESIKEDVRQDVPVLEFDSTGDAYDACQYDDNIKNGDVLLIPSEGVVGIAGTWPVAVTIENGNLHSAKDGELSLYLDEQNMGAGLDKAVATANDHGFEIVPEMAQEITEGFMDDLRSAASDLEGELVVMRETPDESEYGAVEALVRDMAQAYHVDEDSLSRTFEDVYGVHPEEYMMQTESMNEINEDWGSSDWYPIIQNIDQAIERDGVSPESIENAARDSAEMYYDHMGYESVDDAVDPIINGWMRMSKKGKQLSAMFAPKETMDEHENGEYDFGHRQMGYKDYQQDVFDYRGRAETSGSKLRVVNNYGDNPMIEEDPRNDNGIRGKRFYENQDPIAVREAQYAKEFRAFLKEGKK